MTPDLSIEMNASTISIDAARPSETRGSLAQRHSFFDELPDINDKSPRLQSALTIRTEPKSKKKTRAIDELDELKGTV